MFICNTCLKQHYKNDPSFVVSMGECEWCKETFQCNDIPSARLIPIKDTQKLIPLDKNVFIQRFTREDGMPSEGAQYSTDLGYVEVFCGKWMDVHREPEWWMEPISESDYLESILPEEVVDETFIEHEISYQHHGVVRMAINKYKKFLMERLLDKTKDYER